MKLFNVGRVVDVVLGVPEVGASYVPCARALVLDEVQVDGEVSYTVAVKRPDNRPLILTRVIYEPALHQLVVAKLWDNGLMEAYYSQELWEEVQKQLRRLKFVFDQIPAYA